MRFGTLALLAAFGLAFSPSLQAQDDEDFYFASAAMTELNADAENVADLLRAEALDWASTPHVLGGDSRRGIDCSSLMQHWYGNLFGVGLPRTSGEQFDEGEAVDRDDLQPGDLVFFGSRRRITHVGAYVGNGEFAHVSSSVGVTVSRLDEAYWKRRYQGARRVLSLSEVPATFAAAARQEPARAPSPEARPVASAPTFTRASVQGSQPAPARRVGW